MSEGRPGRTRLAGRDEGGPHTLDATLEAAMSDSATVTALRTGPIEKCRQPDADPDAWFPHEPQADRETERAAYEKTARQLCAGCPLISACLERALADEARYGIHPHGVYGGRAPWERHNMHRAAQRRAERLAVAS